MKILVDESVLKQSLEFCEFLWREVEMNDYVEEKREATESALRLALRSALVDPTVTVRYDLSALDTDGAIRQRLIEFGWTPPNTEPVSFWPLAPKSGYYDVNGKRMWLEKDDPFPAQIRSIDRKHSIKD